MDSDPDTGSDLLRLVETCLDAFETGGDAAVEAVLSRHPALAEAARTRLAALKAAGLLDGDESDQIPERLGEFRLLERLGSGGMGIVYLAEQESLGRRVALKVVRPDHAYFPTSHARFRREAEAIARLHHPGIATVYVVGEEAKVPYFAMEYVVGLSLHEVINELRTRRPDQLRGADLAALLTRRLRGKATVDASAEAFAGSWVDTCLRLTLRTVEALTHAHERGVLHRDIKPSNVMVTADGSVRVLDFGLARAENAASITRSGSVLGSLPFMAPEQLCGDTAVSDWRTDVYSVGVTLYQLLTLHFAFWGETAQRTMQLVLDGQPVPIRRRNAAVPWDADTICLTAMDVDPGRRYQSMTALADDLERFLGRRPITARRPGPGLRLWRWTQRRPATVASIVTCTLIALIALMAYQWQAQASDDRVAKERAAARQDSEDSLFAAIDALDEIIAQANAPELINTPQGDPVREALLERAADLFDRLSKQEAEHPELALRVVQAHTGLSGLRFRFGDIAGAVAAAERAVAASSQLQRDQHDHLTAWAAATTSLAQLLSRDRQLEACEELSVELLATLEETPAEWPDRDHALGQAWRALGSLHMAKREVDSALASLQEAADHYELDLARAQHLRSRNPLAATLQSLAYLRGINARGDHRPTYERAIELMRGSLADKPTSGDRRYFLGKALAAWAHVDQNCRRPDEALAHALEAHELLHNAAREYPSRSSYAATFLINLHRLFELLLVNQAHASAHEKLREGLALGEAALDRHPDSNALPFRLALVTSELAAHLHHDGETAAATRHWVRAAELWETAVAGPRPNPSALAQVGGFYDNWAAQLARAGDNDQARDALTKASQHHGRAAERVQHGVHRSQFGQSLLELARLEVRAGNPDAAVVALQRAAREAGVPQAEVAGAPFAAALGERDDYQALVQGR
ncbi:MAG: protein kinase [Planctomycetota bacterium]